MSQQTPHVVRIGVFMPSGTQLLDMACIDVLHMMSREYLGNLAMIPAHVAAVAPSMRIFYITSSPAMTAGRIPLTASAALIPTHDLADSEVGPGELDVVLVPGADPAEEFGEEVTGWLKRQMEEGGADVLCVCTGVYLCGRSGLLEGRRVCGPRGLQADLRKRWPGAEFVGDRLRWTRDGRFWSCGELRFHGCCLLAFD
jgi:transcriptional regulator GlxA family with amidase domain